MFRVKNGPCAPLRLSSMLSRPATGITCIPVTTGAPEAVLELLDGPCALLMVSLAYMVALSFLGVN